MTSAVKMESHMGLNKPLEFYWVLTIPRREKGEPYGFGSMLNKEKMVGKCEGDEWSGAYDSGWRGEIVPEAFAHP